MVSEMGGFMVKGSGNPRRRNGNARDKLRRWLASQGNPCALCGAPIDYDLPSGEPLSFEMDEIIPVSRYRLGGYATPTQCALDRDNVQAVHRICNQRRGNSLIIRHDALPQGDAGVPTSRDWGA